MQIDRNAQLEQNKTCCGSQVAVRLLPNRNTELVFERKSLFFLQITGTFLAQYMLKRENSKQLTKKNFSSTANCELG